MDNQKELQQLIVLLKGVQQVTVDLIEMIEERLETDDEPSDDQS